MYSSGGEPWGEHQYGNWAGAGTNGGTNMVVLDLSHGVKPELWFQQLNAIFAGIHLAATIMPVWGDTNNVPDRGWRFADFYRVNPNSSVGVAWGDTLHSVANGGPCPDDNGNTVGGGHGINGCGCNFVFAMHEWGGWTHSYVYDQSWEHLRDDAYDGYLRTWYTWRAVCNYDVSLYPWHPW
jgi:hypothetical protein